MSGMYPTFDSAAGMGQIPLIPGFIPYLILRVAGFDSASGHGTDPGKSKTLPPWLGPAPPPGPRYYIAALLGRLVKTVRKTKHAKT